eukprot:gene802-2542_t
MRKAVCDYVAPEDKKEPFIRGERRSQDLDFREQNVQSLRQKGQEATRDYQQALATQEAYGHGNPLVSPIRSYSYAQTCAQDAVWKGKQRLDKVTRDLDTAMHIEQINSPPRRPLQEESSGIPMFSHTNQNTRPHLDLTGRSGTSGRKHFDQYAAPTRTTQCAHTITSVSLAFNNSATCLHVALEEVAVPDQSQQLPVFSHLALAPCGMSLEQQVQVQATPADKLQIFKPTSTSFESSTPRAPADTYFDQKTALG